MREKYNSYSSAYNICIQKYSRLVFKRPKALAKMLDVPLYLVMHFITVIAVLCEKEAVINTEAFVAFCHEFLDWFYPSEYSWNFMNPTVIIEIEK